MRLDRATSVLCVIDVQERLVPAIADAAGVVNHCRRLAEGARLLGVPAILTEQYRKGLGATVPALGEVLPPPLLAARLPAPVSKMSFSCCGAEGFSARLAEGIRQVVLCGLETHVCVAQTAIDLLAGGYAVFVVVDAIASRHRLDHDVALRRLEGAGVVPTTTEAVLFEWCRTATDPQFQAIRRLIL